MRILQTIRGKGILFLTILALLVSACGNSDGEAADGGGSQSDELKEIEVVLNWSPNTNHTGLYVADALGYFEEEGLKANIILPGVGGPNAAVGSGNVEFGVGIQEDITVARIQGVPIVSIAAIIQHNTSAFAAPIEKEIKSPKDFEGKVYGGFGSPAEPAVLESLMKADGEADASTVTILNVGEADFFTSVQRDIDFSWIYYGWTGVEAELRGVDLDVIYLTDYSEKLDYYTPVFITNEKIIDNQPELVSAFMRAVTKGYEYSIDNPEKAAEILLEAAPELDKDLVIASQKWLSPRYQDDALRWGEQKLSVWENYAEWMKEYGLLESDFDAEAAFTNDFLPE